MRLGEPAGAARRARWQMVPLLAALACTEQDAAPRPTVHGEIKVAGGTFCNDVCVVDTFKQLATIYRPSGAEKGIRDKLIQLATDASDNRWSRLQTRLQILSPDAVGNFVIRVPATGRFSGRKLPPVAVQAHMDMVLAATDAPPGGDLRAFFRQHPVQIEVKDGKIQSVGHKTSIGADNTVGCAVLLRYALDPGIEHPPLELVFTVHQEVGLQGAQEYDTATLPLLAPVMISLDGFDGDRIVYGGQGSFRRTVSGALPARAVSPGKRIKVTVSHLLGGHSGTDIHQDRLNGVIALAAITKSVLADPTLSVRSAVAGDMGGLNKIPSDLELVLSAPDTFDVGAFRASMEATVRKLVSSRVGEAANGGVNVVVTEPSTAAEPSTALTAEAASRLVDTLLATERSSPPLNGVISKKPGFPNDVNTSSNLGVLDVKLDAASASKRATTIGFMMRSFSTDELSSLTGRLIDHLKSVFDQAEPVTVQEIAGYVPWLEDPESWLIRLALDLEVNGRRPFRTAGVSTVGLEPSHFLMKFPQLRIIGMGATIADPHTVHETVAVQSILDLVANVDAFLVRLADAEPFRTAPLIGR
jgi:dipeptidase D